MDFRYRSVLLAILSAAMAARGVSPPPLATYLGGNGSDIITACITDGFGNLYVTGYTYSSNLPVTPGAFQRTHAGTPGTLFSIFLPQPLADVFVAKFDRAGALVYLTHLGGCGHDAANAIAVDAGGNAIVAGRTSSPDFPVTPGALTTAPPAGGAQWAFVTKLNAAGSGLIYSTYLDAAAITALASDSRGDIYAAGQAASAGALVAKLSGDGARLLYSRVLGGSGDYATGMAVDLSGSAYVAGATSSGAFPVTAGAMQQTPGASVAGFVARLDPAGATLLSSTLLGGSDFTVPFGRIAVDSVGDVSLAGLTRAADFPVTGNALQRTLAGSQDAFVAKLNAAFSALVFSTYLGGTAGETATSLAQDESGNLWVTGVTTSTDFPMTEGASARAFAGSPCLYRGASPFGVPPLVLPCSDAFLVGISADGRTLRYSSTLSGGNQEYASDVALDVAGAVAVVGNTGSNDFPATVDAFQPRRYRAACTTTNSPSSSDTQPCADGFVARFASVPPPSRSFSVLNRAGFLATPVAPGEIVTLIGDRIGPADPTWLSVGPPGLVATRRAGFRVLFDATPGPLIYLDNSRIDVIVPKDVEGKLRVRVAVEREGNITASVDVLVGEAAPGILVQGSGGAGQAAALNEDNLPNSPAHPAAGGSVISLYTLGVATPAGPDGEVASAPTPLAAFPEVVVGDRVARVLYAGPSPGLVAVVTQINLVVPDVAGDAVPVHVLTSGYASPPGAVLSIR